MASGQKMTAAGGLWLAEDQSDRAAVVAEVRERGLRALEVVGDLSFVTALPDLEFLVARDPPDVAPIHALSNLRLLSFPGTWGGRVDAAAWPALERFAALEIPKDGGGVETVLGHPSLRSLDLGRARLVDLRPIRAPRLEALSLAQSRTLVSLAGIDGLASTLLDLTLSVLPALDSLQGLEALGRLEVLHLDGLRRITSLDLVAALPRLRFLDVMDLEGVETLRPLARHPSLEYLAFGPTADLDLEPLFTIPKLTLVLTGIRHGWNRDVHDLPYWHDVPADDPRRLEWNRLAVR
jgi:hypothetical protein